mmetsp:Transcript_19131/g.55487  ORF Transcript_19131/g.55487 Transcript_19131/m.55487 type:complete len:203 (+) Transcript_19131:192-800(+)
MLPIVRGAVARLRLRSPWAAFVLAPSAGHLRGTMARFRLRAAPAMATTPGVVAADLGARASPMGGVAAAVGIGAVAPVLRLLSATLRADLGRMVATTAPTAVLAGLEVVPGVVLTPVPAPARALRRPVARLRAMAPVVVHVLRPVVAARVLAAAAMGRCAVTRLGAGKPAGGAIARDGLGAMLLAAAAAFEVEVVDVVHPVF